MKKRKYRIYVPGKTLVVETAGEIKTAKNRKSGLTARTVEGDTIRNVIMLTEIIEQEVVMAVKQDDDDLEEV